MIKDSTEAWRKEQVPRLAAALAYYTTFSLAPLLVLLIALVGFLWEESVAQEQLLSQISVQFGSETAQFIQNLVSRASISSNEGWVTLLGAITLVFGALGIFSQLRASLNRIWKVRPVPPSGLIESLQINLLNRAISFGIVMLIGLLMILSIIASAAIGYLAEFFGQAALFSDILLEGINFAISFLVITILFALIFRLLPDVEIAWKDTWLGAAVTALLFLIGKTLLGLYLGNGDIGDGFGAAGSLVLIMVFIYYAAQIFFFGAVFTRVYAERFGSHIMPADNAVMIVKSQPAVSDPADIVHPDPEAAPQKRQPAPETALGRQKIKRPDRKTYTLFSLALMGTFLAGYMARGFRGGTKDTDVAIAAELGNQRMGPMPREQAQ